MPYTAAMRTLMPEEEQVAGGKRAVWVRPEQKLWLDRMAAKGWTAPTWPKQYGGGGLSPEEALVLEEEMQALGCRPPLRGMGLSMLGPVLLEYGTEEQRRTHLPKIVTGEIRWCQGYSEPEAGSDLASLRTRAVLQGDHFLVNGHKIWTSNAHLSDWIFCLVRTDPAAKKHEGISFLLIDMDDPGVRPRPIRLISGKSVFCETFIENVRVPKENLVGELNKGWTIAKRLLEHERKGIGGIGARAQARFERPMQDIAKHYAGEENGRIADPALRAQIAGWQMKNHAFQLTRRRAAEAAEAGAACLRINPGNIGSAARVKEVVKAAKDHGCSMRIGVNAGSLEKELLERYGEPCPEAMVESALNHAKILEDNDFTEFKISVKASDPFLAVAAYQGLAEACDYPLHLGVTEAGGMIPGTVKSSIGMGMLLWSGIGDTIRVSLSAEPEEEVRVGFDILKALNLRHRGVNIVSCPSCARQGFKVIETVRALEDRLKHISTPMSLSIIGCVVNGPGEARETDLGFTGGGAGKGHGQIYLNGKPSYRLDNENLIDHVVELCEKKAAEIEAARGDAPALEPAQ